MTRKISVVIEKEENGYRAFAPKLAGCRAQGQTVDETLANFKTAVELSLTAKGRTEQVELLSREAITAQRQRKLRAWIVLWVSILILAIITPFVLFVRQMDRDLKESAKGSELTVAEAQRISHLAIPQNAASFLAWTDNGREPLLLMRFEVPAGTGAVFAKSLIGTTISPTTHPSNFWWKNSYAPAWWMPANATKFVAGEKEATDTDSYYILGVLIDQSDPSVETVYLEQDRG